MNNKKNKGFALVELVIGIAIAAIVSGMVLSIVQFSTDSFKTTTEEEQTLVKAQVITSQLNDYIINTKDAVCYYVQDTLVSNDQNYEDITPGSTDDLANVTHKKISMYDTIGSTIREQTIEWKKSTQELWLDEDTSDAQGAVLLAENVESFSTDLSSAFTDKKIVVMVKVKMNDQSYSVDSKTITLRNNLLINEIPMLADASAAVVTKAITSVTLSPDAATVGAGGQQVFDTNIIANYAVSNNCEYYIIDGDNRVKEIAGVCSINDSGTFIADTSVSFSSKVIQIVSIPLEVSSGSYTADEQETLTGKAEITITAKNVTGTQLIGSATIEAGESENYEAIVSGYVGISQECYYYFKDSNGNRVSELNGATIPNYTEAANEKIISCDSNLVKDQTVVLYAVPKAVDESTTLTDIQKEALTGYITISLHKSLKVVTFKIKDGDDLLTDTIYSYYKNKNKPEDHDYTLQLYYGDEVLNKDQIQSISIRYETYYISPWWDSEIDFYGLTGLYGSYTYVYKYYTDSSISDNYKFATYDYDYATRDYEAYLRITISVTLENKDKFNNTTTYYNEYKKN